MKFQIKYWINPYFNVYPDRESWCEENLDFRDMIRWCNETFCRMNDGWFYFDGTSRWTFKDHQFWFRDEQDLSLFVLKWTKAGQHFGVEE